MRKGGWEMGGSGRSAGAKRIFLVFQPASRTSPIFLPSSSRHSSLAWDAERHAGRPIFCRRTGLRTTSGRRVRRTPPSQKFPRAGFCPPPPDFVSNNLQKFHEEEGGRKKGGRVAEKRRGGTSFPSPSPSFPLLSFFSSPPLPLLSPSLPLPSLLSLSSFPFLSLSFPLPFSLFPSPLFPLSLSLPLSLLLLLPSLLPPSICPIRRDLFYKRGGGIPQKR